MRRQHDYRHVAVWAIRRVAHQLDELDAVQNFHLVIGDDDVDRVVLEPVKGVGGVLGLENMGRAKTAQDGFDDIDHVGVVVHHQEPYAFKACQYRVS